jgi:hypothetical protein
MTKKQQSQFQNYIKSGDLLNVKLNINKIDPSYNENYSVGIASALGYFEIVSLLLNDSRVNPSDYSNYAIKEAYRHLHKEVVNLLWQNVRVKNTLKNDDIEIYNELIKKDIKLKVENFNAK